MPTDQSTETAAPATVGYILARCEGPGVGRLMADWDGEIHATLDAARAELANANEAGEDGDSDWGYRIFLLAAVGSGAL